MSCRCLQINVSSGIVQSKDAEGPCGICVVSMTGSFWIISVVLDLMSCCCPDVDCSPIGGNCLSRNNSAYTIPKFSFLQPYLKPGEGPIVLVLAPTRELAVQIKEECDKFGASSEIKNTVVYGGVPKHKQVRTLREGIEIVIATPVSFIA